MRYGILVGGLVARSLALSLLFILGLLALAACVGCTSPTSPSTAGPWICTTQERCSYPAPYYQRECRRDQYVSEKPCPAVPIP
jgi:hypothetical protein